MNKKIKKGNLTTRPDFPFYQLKFILTFIIT